MLASTARCFSSTAAAASKNVYIASYARTPIGSFRASLAAVPASQLGATAIKGAVERSGLKPNQVDDVYMGNVISAAAGQAPASQASIFAGLPATVPCTTVNKVCSSGMKTVMLAAGTIALGHNNVVVAGGMESMSQVPYYLSRANSGYGNQNLEDGILKDGLTDVYHKIHMGNCAEDTAAKQNITREQQDEFGILSYKRSAAAHERGDLKKEIVPVVITDKRGKSVTVAEDEEFRRVDFAKFKDLKPAFQKDGTVTAGNASTLNDGAAALVLVGEEAVSKLSGKPLARVVGWADAQRPSIEFPIAPVDAVKKLLANANVKISDVALWEFNEAFSAVVLANAKILGLDIAKVNVNGGAVSLGHPIGASGARIVGTLAYQLQAHPSGTYGVAAICNGGGGASAVLLQRL
ncbi:acetyl-CoA acetyltransferase [Capsaspora owczarzaki ATCC 30864]|uniref:acetyl-CoA C-acetyltransferase n=1 Tax=Capsaspora owczarzaki (strain ATCC 30864) TaxID=595528 RepID=A0A0D2X5G1_CAPO3|nr:acetyl-CoA acetyltransferase [Capsaspora owczarzaki ATCC 30864]KJE97749.1 acetyl-CoA acetyltransferase [Capsaspora owczarzaki ATCC 30864]|eukprot:XP_004363276.2 acetyl-CoA acetyltransferase [Capsaspora owczarzaki ATCC 30864]